MTASAKQVRDLMHITATSCSADTLFLEAVRILHRNTIESLIVLDSHSRAIGMLSRLEAVQTYARSGIRTYNFDTLTVAEVMRSNIPQVSPNIPAISAAQIMLDQGLREIYVMPNKDGETSNPQPFGVLSINKVLSEINGVSNGEEG